jgi:hypothetical protein
MAAKPVGESIADRRRNQLPRNGKEGFLDIFLLAYPFRSASYRGQLLAY